MGWYQMMAFALTRPHNLILEGLVRHAQAAVGRRRRASQDEYPRMELARGDAQAVIGWLVTQISAAPNFEGAMDCFEAATAEEVFIHSDEQAFNVALQALRRVFSFAQQARMAPHDFLHQVCLRAFWGRSAGRPVYCRYPSLHLRYHEEQEAVMVRLVLSLRQLEKLKGREWDDAVAEYFSPELYDSRVAQREERNLRQGVRRFEYLWTPNIRARDQIDESIRRLAALDIGTIPPRFGDEIFQHGLTMFLDALSFCLNQEVANARQVWPGVVLQDGRGRITLHVPGLVAVGRRYAARIGMATPVLNTRITLQVPWAMSVVARLVIEYGQDKMSREQGENVIAFMELAGDLCAIGEFLRDRQFQGRTIGDFLAEHPRVDDRVLADAINQIRQRRGHQSRAYRDLLRMFGSVVYWNRRSPGRGLIS